MPNERYDFDKNGNRIKADIQNKEQTYKTAEYNRLISDNESEYKYDLEGNRIAKISKNGSIIKYHWDNRNRLMKIETPNGTIEYFYDHQNRIVLRKQGKNATTFIHDGWQIVLQFDNDKPTHRYLWGTKQDELICDNDNWTLGDHLNTIRDIVKSDGTITDHLEYNSFGKIISATKNDSSLQFAYTGKSTDKASELQWNINRWYDTNVGRWVSEDPIGFEGEDANLFRYVTNNISSHFDSLGLADYSKIILDGEKRTVSYKKTINVMSTTTSIDESLDKVDIHGGIHSNLDYRIGFTSVSPLLLVHCQNFCVDKSSWNARAGQVQTPRFTVGVIVVKLIRPLPATGNDRNIWQHHTNYENEQNNTSGTTISITTLEQRVKNHENHHYQTFVSAIDIIKEFIANYEKKKLDTRAEVNTVCSEAIVKIKRVWSSANDHSSKYDSSSWKKHTYTSTIYQPFTYP
jgi:RHS repeat-associated protein